VFGVGLLADLTPASAVGRTVAPDHFVAIDHFVNLAEPETVTPMTGMGDFRIKQNLLARLGHKFTKSCPGTRLQEDDRVVCM
jgi:hypothetical protein